MFTYDELFPAEFCESVVLIGLCEERLTLFYDLFLFVLLILVHELLEHVICLSMLESSLRHVILKLPKEGKHANPSRYIGSL